MPYFNAQPKGNPIKILDEGVTLTAAVAQIDFVGAGVTGTNVGDNVTETISGAVGTTVTEEVPSGSIDGNNKAFTLAHTPTAGTLKVFLGGARQQSGGGDYTLSGATITFVIAPMIGSILVADYSY